MEHLELVKQYLSVFINFLKILMEAAAAVCVLIGFMRTVQLAIIIQRRRNYLLPYLKLRLRFGMWLGLALEFQLASDILNTTIAPSFDELGKLGVIVLIRTFLNYFLSKELGELYEFEEKAERHPQHASLL